mgnify:CR=1 FL=1
MLICISGVDGAGKSTQLALLDRYLRFKGLKTYQLWLRWFSIFTYFLYFYARLVKRTVVVETRSRPVHVHIFWVDKALQRLYPRVLLLDLLLWFFVKKFVAWVKRVDVMLIDRSFLDAVVDLLWEVRDVGFLRSIVGRVIWRVISSMKVLILIIEPKEAVKRKSDIVSLRKMAFEKRCFEILAKHLSIPILNTTGIDIIITFRELLKVLEVSWCLSPQNAANLPVHPIASS